MKCLINTLIFVIIFFQGCSTKKEPLKSYSIDDIQKNKDENRFVKIKLINKSDKESFQVFIDKNDRINYICYKGLENCNYYDEKKHSYEKSKDVEEDIIWMYKTGFSPNLSNINKKVQCGRGSFMGVLLAYKGIWSTKAGLRNHNNYNRKLCYNRFSKISSLQILERIPLGIITFGSSIITGGNMHTKEFDKTSFIEAIINSSLDSYKDDIFGILANTTITSGFTIIYLNIDDIEKSLEDVYNRIKFSKSNQDGIILIDEQNNQIISTIFFNNYKNRNIMKNISFQINDILNRIGTNLNKQQVLQNDILKYLPNKIIKPSLPTLPTLIKDEFETKYKFETRIFQAVKKREQQIRNLQKQYDLDINKRNNYIHELEESYASYINKTTHRHKDMRKGLKENMGLLSKILFVQNLNGFYANDFTYDSESKQMYFNISSGNGHFKHKVISKIPSRVARQVKLTNSYKIEPVLEFKQNSLILKEFVLEELINKEEFSVSYTNINFSPMESKVTISTSNEKINASINNVFGKYKQSNAKLLDIGTKEVWYIDVVKRINAKVPKWFSNPKKTNEIIAYAQADNLETAKLLALSELASMIKVRIISDTSLYKSSSNMFKNYREFKRNIKSNTNVELDKNEYSILRQEKMDGVWYVTIVYNFLI